MDGGKSGSYKSKNAGVEGNCEGNKKSASQNKDSPLYKLLNAKQSIKNKGTSWLTPGGAMVFNMGVQLTKQFVTQTANYYISDIGRKNGDSNYQQLVNRNIEIASDVGSFLTSAASGAATGSMFGPAGAVVGAVVGVASSAMSLGFRQAERQREYQHTMFKNNTSQAYNLARANYSAYTGRVR